MAINKQSAVVVLLLVLLLSCSRVVVIDVDVNDDHDDGHDDNMVVVSVVVIVIIVVVIVIVSWCQRCWHHTPHVQCWPVDLSYFFTFLQLKSTKSKSRVKSSMCFVTRVVW